MLESLGNGVPVPDSWEDVLKQIDDGDHNEIAAADEPPPAAVADACFHEASASFVVPSTPPPADISMASIRSGREYAVVAGAARPPHDIDDEEELQQLPLTLPHPSLWCLPAVQARPPSSTGETKLDTPLILRDSAQEPTPKLTTNPDRPHRRPTSVAGATAPVVRQALDDAFCLLRGCLKPSRLVIGDPSDGRRPFTVDFDSLFLDALLQAAPVDESSTTSAPPIAPLVLVAFLERRMKALAASGKELHVVMSQELEVMWPTATLRFSRRILWAHVRRLAMDDAIGLSLTANCLRGGAKGLINQLEATLPVCFLMQDTNELPLNLSRRRSLFHNLGDYVADAMPSLDAIQYALLHIKMRVLHASVAVVHFSDVSMAGATISGISQVYNGDRAALLKHLDYWALSMFPSVAADYETIDNVQEPEQETNPAVDFTESCPTAQMPSSTMLGIQRVLEAAVSHAGIERHISAAAQRVWEIHSLIIQTAPLSLRALAPITGDWHQLACVIEEVLIYAMEIMDANFHCPIDALADDPSCIDAYDPRLLAFLSLPRHQHATSRALQLSLENPSQALPWGMSVMPAHRMTGQTAGSNILINHFPALKETKMFRALEDAGINWGKAESVFSAKHAAADIAGNGLLEIVGGMNPSGQFYHFYDGSLLNTEQGNALELHDRHWHNSRPLSIVDWYKKLASDREQSGNTRFENLKEADAARAKKKMLQKRLGKGANFWQQYSSGLEPQVSKQPLAVRLPHRLRSNGGICKTGKKAAPDKRQQIEQQQLKKQQEKEWEKVKKWMVWPSTMRLCAAGAVDYISEKCIEAEAAGMCEEMVVHLHMDLLCRRLVELAYDVSGPSQRIMGTAYCALRTLCSRYTDFMGPKDRREVIGSLCRIGLRPMAASLAASWALPASLLDTAAAARQFPNRSQGELTASRFQLRHLGSHLQRPVSKAASITVGSHTFQPDDWQRHMIDAVNNRQSLLAVAPTSSGKTFISYYCIERVLQHNKGKSQSSHQRVVFVMPTRALVNQTCAGIYSKYGEKYGSECMAVWHRDQRDTNIDSASILVTVPAMLEIKLLLGGPGCREWVKSLQYAIIDEVHSIGEESQGATWERMLALVPCPVVCLSATVGNVPVLQGWLELLEANKAAAGHGTGKLILAEHGDRWNDLHMKAYVPKTPRTHAGSSFEPQDVEWCLGQDPSTGRTRSMVNIHPIGLLATATGSSILAAGVHLRNPSMAPDEALQLYDCMRRHLGSSMPIESPEERWSEDVFIDQASARAWGKLLTSHLEDIRRDEVLGIAAELLEPAESAWNQMEVTLLDSQSGSMPDYASGCIEHGQSIPRGYSTSRQFVLNNFFDMLLELDAEGMLPAIVFCMSRSGCVDLALEAAARLQAAAPDTAREVETLKAEIEDLRSQLTCIRRRQQADDIEESIRSKQARITKLMANPLFSFAGQKVNASSSTDYFMERLAEDWQFAKHPCRDQLMRALELGIGVHHGGMGKRYRQAVEALFRHGKIRVCIATGTLAMGINMPARTVCFAGDFPMINSMLFRQFSGRAGRRGYDDAGNVVFLGVGMNRVASLVCNQLTGVFGNFAVNTTTAARLATLFAKTHDSEHRGLAQSVKSLLVNPLSASAGSHELHNMMLHHFLFSNQLLLCRGVLQLNAVNRTLEPVAPLSALAERLYYHEPGNLTLIDLVQTQVLQRYVNENPRVHNDNDAAIAILEVFAHLFNTCPVPSWSSEAEEGRQYVLAALPEEIQHVIRMCNRRTLDLLLHYLAEFVAGSSSAASAPPRLAFSGTQLPAWTSPAEGGQAAALRDLWVSMGVVIDYSIRSPFVALMGRGDDFQDAAELVGTMSEALQIDEAALPFFPLGTKGSRQSKYLVDFYKRGGAAYKAVIRDSGIRDDNLFRLLQDTSLCLSAIRECLQVPEGYGTAFSRGLDLLTSRFKEELRQVAVM